MKEFRSADIRNIAIVGHGASGKTMLSEAILASVGTINRMGTIESKSTISDYHDDEKERQISIYSSLLTAEWREKKINILDVPGYADFVGEALGALRVADLAVVVVHATHGVEVGTEQVWDHATNYGIPKMIVLNALDKEHVNFDEALKKVREHFGARVFPLTVPIKVGPGFNQIASILDKKVFTFNADKNGKYDEADLSADWKDEVESMYSQMLEYVAESDDALLEKFFDKGALSDEELQKGMHAALINQTITPLFCISGVNNVGVAPLLDFITKFGPSPMDRATIDAINEKGEKVSISLTSQETVAFVFKTLSEAQAGDLSLFRIYSGAIKGGMNLYNSNRFKEERIGQMFVLNGKNRAAVDHLCEGDIGAVVKLKDTHTNNTLCSPKHVVKLAEIVYPKPNIHVAIQPKKKGEEEKMSLGLHAMREEDMTFIFKVDPELHQMVISGQGELHLGVIISRLRNRFGLEIDMFQPKIAYRETVRGIGDSKYRHKKQSGGAGQFAEVWMRVEPKERGAGVEFTNSLVGQNVDRVFVPSVEKGVMLACEKGDLAGYHIVDVKVDFYDGKQHPVDSKDIAFQIAGRYAFQEAFMAAKPYLLEPILSIEIKVPEEYVGTIMGDISGRRGKISGVDIQGPFQVIKALVPQSELYKYSTTLRSITGGRGYHIEEFHHYEAVPHEIEQKIVEAAKLLMHAHGKEAEVHAQ